MTDSTIIVAIKRTAAQRFSFIRNNIFVILCFLFLLHTKQKLCKKKAEAEGFTPVIAETLAEGCTAALKPGDLHVPHWTEPIHASCLRSDGNQKVRENGDDDTNSGSSVFTFSHASPHVFFDVVVVLHVFMCRRFCNTVTFYSSSFV